MIKILVMRRNCFIKQTGEKMILEILYYPTIILTLFLEFKQLCELGFFSFELKLLHNCYPK